MSVLSRVHFSALEIGARSPGEELKPPAEFLVVMGEVIAGEGQRVFGLVV